MIVAFDPVSGEFVAPGYPAGGRVAMMEGLRSMELPPRYQFVIKVGTFLKLLQI